MTIDLNRESIVIPSLEEQIEKANYAWATDEVRSAIVKYWGKRGTNREQVHKAICEHFDIEGVSFNQMRYFVHVHMRDEMSEKEDEAEE